MQTTLCSFYNQRIPYLFIQLKDHPQINQCFLDREEQNPFLSQVSNVDKAKVRNAIKEMIKDKEALAKLIQILKFTPQSLTIAYWMEKWLTELWYNASSFITSTLPLVCCESGTKLYTLSRFETLPVKGGYFWNEKTLDFMKAKKPFIHEYLVQSFSLSLVPLDYKLTKRDVLHHFQWKQFEDQQYFDFDDKAIDLHTIEPTLKNLGLAISHYFHQEMDGFTFRDGDWSKGSIWIVPESMNIVKLIGTSRVDKVIAN